MSNFDISRHSKNYKYETQRKNSAVKSFEKIELPVVYQPRKEYDIQPDQQANLPNAKERFQKKFPLRSWKTYAAVIALCIIILVGTVAGKLVSFAQSVSLTGTPFYKSIGNDVGATLGSSIPQLQKLDQTAVGEAVRGNKSVNILLLGYGGDGHSGAYLTDTMMVMNLNYATRTVTMIAVPRDIWLDIPTDQNGGTYWKINAAYEIGLDPKRFPDKAPEFSGPEGGGNLAEYEAGQVTGLTIDHYVAMDFDGFKKIVDTLGGVTIDVADSFTDYQYPNGDQNTDGPDCETDDPTASDCRYIVVHFDAGVQAMDGDRALEYVRSRHAAGAEGSDFARSKRQQKLIAAIQEKALSFNEVSKVFALMNDIHGHFQTDLSVAEIKDLSTAAGEFNFNNAAHISVDDNGLLASGRSADGQYILGPAQGKTWDDIHQYIFNVLNNVQTTQG